MYVSHCRLDLTTIMWYGTIPHTRRRRSMAAYPFKTRLHPFRVLALLLYGEQEYIINRGNCMVEARVGPMARALRVPNYRLKEYVDWLQKADYVSDITHSNGSFTVKLKKPRNTRYV